MLAMGQHKILAVQQLADRSYRLYMGMDAPEELYRRPLSHKDTEDIRQRFLSSLDFFANWAPNLKEYLANAEGPFHAWPLYRLPVSSVSWNRVPGVTLLGDAAHLATPLVGEGVNMAMLDALMLSTAIAKHSKQVGGADIEGDRLEDALKEYEQEMFERGQDYIRRCMAREGEFFSENAAEDFINMINGAMQDGQEEAE
jgi:2-polyprenyl-6-methoxyphenol hydroxylase-like FAD-dependent oxidoreductase